MKTAVDVEKRIELITTIFHSAFLFADSQTDEQKLINYLEATEQEYISVAYEGAAMAMALKDFSLGETLKLWRAFLEGAGKKHRSQIHIGLGWAIAQSQTALNRFLDDIDEQMLFRVVDGCGYYEGVFRQKLLIKKPYAIFEELSMPDYIDKIMTPYFAQGLGRSIWYKLNGNVTKIENALTAFSSALHADLWRGIGIACAYVGGCNKEQLATIFSLASVHQDQLIAAANWVAESRIEANSFTPDTELALKVWSNSKN